MDRMQIYQNLLNAYASAQKAGKDVDLPPSIDKMVGILESLPEGQVMPVISLLVTCEYDRETWEALMKLFKERGLSGKQHPKKNSTRKPRSSPKELIDQLETAGAP